MSKPRLLAHICCAPDAAYVVSLLSQDFEVTAYFYNPNIHPRKEYDLRLEEARRVAERLDFPLLEGEYDAGRWMRITAKFRDEPEKGRRCDVCYALRLERTARAAVGRGFEYFTTVMSLSPWKKAPVLNRQGRMFGLRFGVLFLEADFKKKDGFRKSTELSRNLGLYRQQYCGCLFSLQERKARSHDRGDDRENPGGKNKDGA